MSQEKCPKQKSAELAVQTYITDETLVLGLGTGSTAKFAVEAIALRNKERAGWNPTCICTSEATEALAKELGLQTVPFTNQAIDVAIDGADELDPAHNLIKGGGGALLREKHVEMAAKKLVIIADESKVVGCLGKKFLLPVEVVKFGWELTQARIERAFEGVKCQRRGGDAPFSTDESHFILDCNFNATGITDPEEVGAKMKAILGVVEHGLFVGMTDAVCVGYKDTPAKELLKCA